MSTKTATKVTPLADRVVIKPLEESETMRGGRYEDGKRVPLDVKTGDKVLYGKYSGTEVTVDGEQVLILRESDILAVIG
jgi:chaperonin GroES